MQQSGKEQEMKSSSRPGDFASSKWQRIAPVITLLLLAPIISEVLSGSTRITTMFVLLPEIGIWGCGALIIRFVARRWHKDWLSIFLMGMALAVAEECIIQQTSLAPLVGVDPNHVYSRALGVNWLYLLWALGYESIWVVMIPIQLTELIFPSQKDDPWMGSRGLVIAAIFFVLASFNAWYFWTQIFVPTYFPAAAYQPPVLETAVALAAILILILIALMRPPTHRVEQNMARLAPRPLIVGLMSFVFGLLWFLLILLAYGAVPTLPVLIPFLGSLILGGLGFTLLKSWTSSSGWQDAHRLALMIGIIVATGWGGFIVLTMNVVFTMSNALMIDRVGQVGFNAIAILLLVFLSRRSQFSTS